MPDLSVVVIPFAIAVLCLLVLVVVGRLIRTNYIKVPPHMVAVVSGRRHKIGEATVGYRVVRGGATFVWPFFERIDDLDLRVITIADLVVRDAITKEGVPLTVKAVANIKIGSEDAILINAVERLMGKHQEDIRKLAYETLEGHLRSMLGTLTVEEVNSDRAAFSQKMISESQTDLARLGLKIDILTVKELSDSNGYLEALGKKRTAEIKRDAEIGSAQAERESVMKSTTAQREGEVLRQGNLAQEAEAEKDKNVKVAQYLAATNAEKARADQAGPLATAEARKAVVEREQEVELARTLKATEVAQAEAARRQQELVALTIRPAEAKREAAVAEANGKARAIEIEAEAEKRRLIAEGTGRAEAKKLEMLAEAEGTMAA